VLRYLDESGFCLCLPPSYTWTLKGSAHQHRVKTRWGSKGRINLIGTLRVGGEGELLEYEMLEGGCRSGEVIGYLEVLAEKARQEARDSCVVVLDNAPFHRAGVLQERRAEWESKGLRLYYLPAYCPHLNPIEGVWKKLKGFLMPRRFYDTLAELKEAVLSALRLLGAVEVHSQLGDT
jgi:putative transposase